MTVINPSSISGITSITMPSGDGNVLTIHTNDGVERFRIDSSGNIKVGTAATISPDGDLFVTGVCTATTLSGAASGLTGALPAIDGSALTGIAATDNVRTGILDVAGIATFRNDVNIGAAVTISESGIEASGIGITCKNINGGSIGGRRNMFINGSCVIGQRGSTASLQSGYGGVDRYYFYNGGDGRVTFSQDTDVPTGSGFSHSIKLDVTTADSNGASNRGWFGQRVERDICQRMKKGTSSATKSTVSFWIKSPKTGTHIVRIYDNVNDRDVGATYTVSSANTWEHKVVTFPADTTGAISNGTTYGMQVYWLIVSGSNSQTSALGTTWATYSGGAEGQGGQNLLDSTDNNIYFTGLQWEVGDEATEFEHRSVAEETTLCQRYYFRFTTSTSGTNVAMGWQMTSSAAKIVLPFPTSMRTRPTAVETTGTASDYSVSRTSTYEECNTVPTFAGASKEVGNVNTNQTQASLSTGQSVALRANSTSFYLGFSAEL